jgi:hypothetical protein
LLHLADQHLGLEGLGHEIVRADLDSLVLVKGLECSGEKDDGHRTQCGHRTQGGADLVPVLVRHHQIHEHEIGSLLLRLADGLLAAPRLDEDKILLAEGQLHDLLDRHAVIRHQDPSGHAILLGEYARGFRPGTPALAYAPARHPPLELGHSSQPGRTGDTLPV